MHQSIILHGSLHPLPETVHLNAGRLSMIYEAGFLRRIKIGGTEVVRMINHLIRDVSWSNVPMTILSEVIDKRENSFTISYTARCIEGDIQFDWTCVITGHDDDTLDFRISGISRNPFRRNRLGFTILHPIETTEGKSCTLTHADNSTEQLYFPKLISPHQPFLDIKAMRWSPVDGVEATLDFEGDLFETEDQRNWLDASFKTYCTPLTLPYPHLVKEGDKVEQALKFAVTGNPPHVEMNRDEFVKVDIERNKLYELPEVGVMMSNLHHNETAMEKIKALNLDFIRVALRDDQPEWTEKMLQAVKFGSSIEVALFVGKDFNTAMLNALVEFKKHITAITLLPTYLKSADADFLEAMLPVVRQLFPDTKIGSGTDGFFTELNRERTPAGKLDFVSFSVNPQSHASDIRTMTENLVTHSDVVNSCRHFSHKAIRVAPITLKIRWNPSAKGEVHTARHSLPADADPKILSLFAAGWTLGSVKYLSESGTKAATYFETVGWKGLVSHADQPWPEAFGVSENRVHPPYFILKELLKYKNQKVGRLVSSEPLKLDGIVFIDGDGRETIFLANYNEHNLRCLVSDLSDFSYFIFDEKNFDDILNGPKEPVLKKQSGEMLTIPPFGIAIIKGS
ncbi:MAG: hypothetical protein ABIS36_13355 [Chryseolinea sp.]